MFLRPRITKPWWSLHQSFTINHRFSIKLKFSSSSESKVSNCLDKECEDFLPWLERKAGVEISSKLYIGKSAYGRSLFASRSIQAGECILKVPYNVQISSDILSPEVKSMLGDKVGNVAKLALVLLVEQKLGKESEWAPYISHLPQSDKMHSTIFWSKSELEMICPSSVYHETVKQKAQIEKDFWTLRLALQHKPEILGDITLKDFVHAYALVGSRAWAGTKDVSLIPFADFLNHDGVSEAIVLNDEDTQVSEVIADHNYAPHEEVLIRYGKFSNSTLLLDFGFTLPYNIHDQVEIKICIPHHDSLCQMKLEILQRHPISTLTEANGLKSSVDPFIFTIKEVRSVRGKGKGLPQSLRAFARILSCTSPQDLSDLAMEAAQNDGRLARCPLKNSSREIQAHEILLSHITQLIVEYDASIKTLGLANSPYLCKRLGLRRQMALDLLTGKLRILISASSWLKNYCATLLQQIAMVDATDDYEAFGNEQTN